MNRDKTEKETRDNLKKKVAETTDALRKETEMIKETVKSSIKDADIAMDQTQEKARDAKKDIAAGVDKIKQDIHETTKKVKKTLK